MYPRFSPRARGCSAEKSARREASTVFPACAGMFLRFDGVEPFVRCFPRVRGDVPVLVTLRKRAKPFSPRARGCSTLPTRNVLQHSFPRVRGDVPKLMGAGAKSLLFSPRARGCSENTITVKQMAEVFPACAGMFRTINEPVINCKSFSPRARGCSAAQGLSGPFDEVFPACAGMFPT